MASDDLVEAAHRPAANDGSAPLGNMEGNSLDDDDVEPPMPSAYPLCTNEGRCGFLEAYIWRGEEVLWEAVNHVWNQLLEPKAQRCTMMGFAAGTGGAGKKALVPLLRRALREALDHELVQPDLKDYPDIDAFHQASMAFFAADYALYEKAIQKYADILNGGAEGAPHTCRIIAGPWKEDK